MVSHWVVYFVVPDKKLKDVHQLGDCMALFYNNLFRPMSEHRIAVFHPEWHGWRKNLECLSYNIAGFNGVSFEEAVKHLKNDPLVYGKFGNDVTKQQMTF